MNLQTEPYDTQTHRWPERGRHILAQYDDHSIVVYQAYNAAIGRFAIENGKFGGGFSYSRMSWIKPNFLWMMYRSGWGQKENQETILGLRLRRSFFEKLLASAVASSFGQSHFQNQTDWKAAIETSDVRLQWDPDHDPHGRPVERRAIQLGLRGEVLEEYGKSQLLDVMDLTEFVAELRQQLEQNGPSMLCIPSEKVYVPDTENTSRQLKLD